MHKTTVALYLGQLKLIHTIETEGSAAEHAQRLTEFMQAMQAAGQLTMPGDEPGGLGPGEEGRVVNCYVVGSYLDKDTRAAKPCVHLYNSALRHKTITVYPNDYGEWDKLWFEPDLSRSTDGPAPEVEMAKAKGLLRSCPEQVVVRWKYFTGTKDKDGSDVYRWKFLRVDENARDRAGADITTYAEFEAARKNGRRSSAPVTTNGHTPAKAPITELPAPPPTFTESVDDRPLVEKITSSIASDDCLTAAALRKLTAKALSRKADCGDRWNEVVLAVRRKLAKLSNLLNSQEIITLVDDCRGVLGSQYEQVRAGFEVNADEDW